MEFGKHEQSGDDSRCKLEAFDAQMSTRQPHLLVGLAAEVLERRQLRLDFDHERGAASREGREDVDRASFAEHGVADFNLCLPAVRSNHVDDRGNEGGMCRVEQAIQLPSAPADRAFEPCVDRSEQPSHAPNRDGVEVAALDERHELLRHPGPVGQFALGQTPSLTKQSKRSTQPDVIHADRMPVNASPALMLRLLEIDQRLPPSNPPNTSPI